MPGGKNLFHYLRIHLSVFQRIFPHPVRQNIPGSPLKILQGSLFPALQSGNGLFSQDHSDIRPEAVSTVGNTDLCRQP